MKTLDYICPGCGHSMPIEYSLDGVWQTEVDECSQCKVTLDGIRVANIIHDLLNPPDLNPTQEQYIEREVNNDKNSEQGSTESTT